MSQNTKIKPTDIPMTLNLAKAARKLGKNVIPCYSGDAGIGKSEICQQWVKGEQKINPKFGFRDLRMAYLEAPDVVGLPKVCSETNRTQHVLPEFWPTEGEGLLLLEEINRANSSVMNTVMQLLTDRKVHNYTLPEGWIIAVPINPDSAQYDVNSMDTALRNRMIIYNVGYDHKSFVDFTKQHAWHPMLTAFIQSGAFVFKSADEIGAEGTYVSPRTLSMLNNAMIAGLEHQEDIFYSTVVSILGSHLGREFYKFMRDVQPLLMDDFVKDEAGAMKRLKKFCEGKNYKGDIVNILTDSIIENFQKIPECNIDLVCKVSQVIAKDQVYNFIMGCIKQSQGKLKLADFIKHDPKLETAIKNSLRG